jgi:hypothetical protein
MFLTYAMLLPAIHRRRRRDEGQRGMDIYDNDEQKRQNQRVHRYETHSIPGSPASDSELIARG